MRISILLLFSGLVFTSCSEKTPETTATKKVILAVFAHPDDETTVTPVLAKYAEEGHDVYLAIATDGRYGVTVHAGIPAGDSLATARAEELKCATAALGIKEPIMFGLHDQLKMQGGFGPLHDQLNELREQTKKLFEELKPDVVITWSASGWSGHHDHRLVGSVVTEVFESKKWDKPYQLYYPGIPTGILPEQGSMFATMDSVYLNVKVESKPVHYESALKSLYCHRSQYTRQQMDEMRGLIGNALGNITWFRSHHEPAPKEGLF
jgi:LmbE family N-acetylglucosaminyl deacetylase